MSWQNENGRKGIINIKSHSTTNNIRRDDNFKLCVVPKGKFRCNSQTEMVSSKECHTLLKHLKKVFFMFVSKVCCSLCNHVCMYVFKYVCMYVCMDGWMYVCMDGWMDGCMYGWMDGWMDVWMDGWMYMYTNMYIYIYVYIYIYIYMYIYIYIHRHVFRLSQDSSVWLWLTRREQHLLVCKLCSIF